MRVDNVAQTQLDWQRAAILLFCIVGTIFFASPSYWLGLRSFRFELANDESEKVSESGMVLIGAAMVFVYYAFAFIGHWWMSYYSDPKRDPMNPQTGPFEELTIRIKYTKRIHVVSVFGSGFLTVVLAQLLGTWISSLIDSDVPMFIGYFQVYNLVIYFFVWAGVITVFMGLALIYLLFYLHLGHLSGALFTENKENHKPKLKH